MVSLMNKFEGDSLDYFDGLAFAAIWETVRDSAYS